MMMMIQKFWPNIAREHDGEGEPGEHQEDVGQPHQAASVTALL